MKLTREQAALRERGRWKADPDTRPSGYVATIEPTDGRFVWVVARPRVSTTAYEPLGHARVVAEGVTRTRRGAERKIKRTVEAEVWRAEREAARERAKKLVAAVESWEVWT